MKTDSPEGTTTAQRRAIYTIIILSAFAIVAFLTFSDALLELVRRWRVQEEYSHGFLIPVIVAWLLWTRRDAIVASIGPPSWMGPALIFLAAGMHITGKLSSLYFLSQFSFIVVIIGVMLGLGGRSLLKVTLVPIVFLLFAIPLPYFIDAVLSWRLQIISSELGVAFIRLFQIPVYLEGNVIDLGLYKLQVVEACSGLTYLYPLMCLGFLAAYFFQAPLWQRALIFLSTIPITILMNSVRIGVVGIVVDNFGPQDADGFLHMFEGWIIFIACAGLLVGGMELLARTTSGKTFFQVFYPPKIKPSQPTSTPAHSVNRVPLISCLALLCAAGIGTYLVSARQEILPMRSPFAAFPTKLGDWAGRTSSLDRETEKGLGMTDYIISDFVKRDGRPVNLYIAYYATQRSGVSPHSPSVCLPGNGWQMSVFERTSYASEEHGISLPLNRVIMTKGADRELVYYWFEERGLKIANEYISKLYLLKDAILKNRTDGALVRLTTPVFAGETDSDADKRLQQFMQILMPSLAAYLPADNTSQAKAALSLLKMNNH